MDGSTITAEATAAAILPGVAIHRGIALRPGVTFSIVTDETPVEPICATLAARKFPTLVRPIVELAEALTSRSARILDLGSHVGTFALTMSALGREVVAVEASPRNAALVEMSRRVNRFDRLRVIPAAVGECAGELQFFANGPYGHVDRGASMAGTVTVRAVAVDDLLAEVGWEHVDFIKLDVEGSEIAALLGMSRLLRRPDAPPILVESNGHTLHLFEETPNSLKAALQAYGYRLFQAESSRLIPIGLDDHQGTTVVDYLAIKGDFAPSRPWQIVGPMSAKEQVDRVKAACASPSDDERFYSARTIGQAPRSLQDDRRVVQAMTKLQSDPVEAIRRAASAWCLTASPRPWYAFWRR